MGNTTFNMKLTDTERDIMDFVTEVVFDGYNFSKSDTVSVLFKKSAIDYLGFGMEWHEISDEELLFLLKQKKREEDKKMIHFMGAEQYRAMIEKFKVDHPKNDCSYLESLLQEVEQELEDKKNE